MYNGYVVLECDGWKLRIESNVTKAYHSMATLTTRDLELIVVMARLCSHTPTITIEEKENTS